ncbi:MAG: DUF2076 domain-containing protein [Pseudolabrys sp.]
MTPQERQMVDELFDKLATLEKSPRDSDAARAIAGGLARAPNAIYPLVQTVLVQDEALKRADARIRELNGEGEAPSGGFLDSMRNALTGGRGSVPSVRANANDPDPRWNRGGVLPQGAPQAAPIAPQSSGGSFLGTAAAGVAGVVGGALLLNSFSSMFGHHGGSAFGAPASGSPPSGSPWDNSAANSDLARDAGLNDIGRGSAGSDPGVGLVDSGGSDFGGGDVGGGDGGGGGGE